MAPFCGAQPIGYPLLASSEIEGNFPVMVEFFDDLLQIRGIIPVKPANRTLNLCFDVNRRNFSGYFVRFLRICSDKGIFSLYS
jgi:hypothetical protein